MVKTKDGFVCWAEASLFLFLLMVLCNSENASNRGKLKEATSNIFRF